MTKRFYLADLFFSQLSSRDLIAGSRKTCKNTGSRGPAVKPRGAGRRMTIVLLLWLGLLTFTSTAAAPPTNRLKNLNSQINQLQIDLKKSKTERVQLELELKQITDRYNKTQENLTATNRDLILQTNRIKQLQKNSHYSQLSLQQQQINLAKQLHAVYLLDQQTPPPTPLMLLSQTTTNDTDRMVIYYQYLNKYYLTLINQWQNKLNKSKEKQLALQDEYQTLTALKAKQQNEQQELAAMEKSRNDLITQTNHILVEKNAKLATLIANKKRLEQTIAAIKSPAFHPTQGKQSFAQLKGHLSWPAKGKVLSYFGSKIDQSELRWEGVLIKAPTNQPVYAIADGRVVFAKWLSGYGLLLIINHGHNYMTLYARNQNLYKSAGDIVHQGDMIATVGKSGGYQQPALYFAIRHNTQPINPNLWCR